MKTMQTSDIRHKFIEFFKSRGHTYVPSASTVPVGDKTILFTIAGMAQFKSCFTGQETRPYKRATNSQKCIRVADLDDVGKDGRHLTMFEMLGSWSFGDYYKKDAIAWAYEFVKNEVKLDLSKLWISVHHTDHETALLWQTIGVPENKIVRLGDKDNFWAMGPTGPCGPCTEMYFDQGEQVGSCAEAGIDCKGPGCECDRFLEFWNLVFMQFQRDENGKLNDLPIKSVDTGMGLERLAALLQGKTNTFEIDILHAIRNDILSNARLINKSLADNLEHLTPEQRDCTNVIADHVRFLCFTISDGASFSNEGRGYVLRRVLRRAVRYVDKLCPDWQESHSFFIKVINSVIEQMGDFFPELKQNQNRIETLITKEEIQFRKTLKSGLSKFYEFLNEAKFKNKHILSGEHVFTLHDTFGFPADLTRILCEENNFSIDMQSYENFMREQKEKSRADAKFYKFAEDSSPWVTFHEKDQKEDSVFNGYFLLPNLNKDNINYFEKCLPYTHIKKMRQLQNNTFELVIRNTPFYPEGGGQIADKGFIEIRNGEEILKFDVIDVKRTPAYITHILHHEDWSNQIDTKFTPDDFKGMINPGTLLLCYVNLSFRQDVAKHHTATHLLHKALQIVLGENLRQAGSLVKNDMLRFDFSYNSAISKHDIQKIENIVNEEILKNSIVYTHKDVPIAEAKNMGAMAMFDEKYDDNSVRVLQIENFSIELCGGTHVTHTGDIGQFKILSESSVTSGVRRIEAVAGIYSLEYTRTLEDTIDSAATELKCAKIDLLSKISLTKDFVKQQEKTILDLQNKIVDLRMKEILQKSFSANISESNHLQIIAEYIPDCSLKELELLCDKIKEHANHIAILGTVIDGKAHLIAGMHPYILKQHKNIHLGKLMLTLCEQLGGKGGGRADFAKGSGPSIEKINDVLSSAKSIFV